MPLTRPEEGRLGPARGRGGPGRRESGPSETPSLPGIWAPTPHGGRGAGPGALRRGEGVEGYGFEGHSRPGVGGAGAGAGRGHLPGTRPELRCQGAPAAFVKGAPGDGDGDGDGEARPRAVAWQGVCPATPGAVAGREGSGQHPQPSAGAGRHRGREEPGALGCCSRRWLPRPDSCLPPSASVIFMPVLKTGFPVPPPCRQLQDRPGLPGRGDGPGTRRACAHQRVWVKSRTCPKQVHGAFGNACPAVERGWLRPRRGRRLDHR